MRPSRGVTSIYLAAAIVSALVTFSDDWHAIVNDGVAVTALSVRAAC
jgi:low affinity Fe/Cu permease